MIGRTWANIFSTSDNQSVCIRADKQQVRLGRRTKVDNSSRRMIRLWV